MAGTRLTCQLLRTNDPSLTELCTECDLYHGRVKDLARAMVGNTNLKSLEFWFPQGGISTTRLLAKAIRRSRITTLVIHCCSSTKIFKRNWDVLFLDGIRWSTSIRKIEFDHNGDHDLFHVYGGVECLNQVMSCIQELQFRMVDARSIYRLGEEVAWSQLKQLNICFSPQYHSHRTISTNQLSHLVTNNSPPKTLILQGCEVSGDIADELPPLQLETLEFVWSNVSPQVLLALLQTTAKPTSTLTTLRVREMYWGYSDRIDIGVIQRIADLLATNTLLSLKHFELSQSSICYASPDFTQDGFALFLRCVRSNTHLHTLVFDRDWVIDFDEFQFYLCRNRLRDCFFTAEQTFPPAIWCHVMCQYRKYPSCIMFILQQQPMLVHSVVNNRTA